MRYTGKVNEKWFNEQASTFAVAPKFETCGIKTVTRDTWSKQTIRETNTELQNYRKLSDYQSFTDAEYIYIWFHLDEYDVQTIEEKSNNKFGKSITLHKIIYPKALLQDLSKGVFEGHAENYVEKHIQWAMINLLSINGDKVINRLDMSTPPTPKAKIEEFKNWSEEFVTLQLERISCLETLFKMCKASYTQLLSKVEVYGGWDKFREEAKQKFIPYLEENFPLHIGDNEPDEELRKLSQWVAEGRNKGFNERLQIIQAGGSQCSPSNYTNL